MTQIKLNILDLTNSLTFSRHLTHNFVIKALPELNSQQLIDCWLLLLYIIGLLFVIRNSWKRIRTKFEFFSSFQEDEQEPPTISFVSFYTSLIIRYRIRWLFFYDFITFVILNLITAGYIFMRKDIIMSLEPNIFFAPTLFLIWTIAHSIFAFNRRFKLLFTNKTEDGAAYLFYEQQKQLEKLYYTAAYPRIEIFYHHFLRIFIFLIHTSLRLSILALIFYDFFKVGHSSFFVRALFNKNFGPRSSAHESLQSVTDFYTTIQTNTPINPTVSLGLTFLSVIGCLFLIYLFLNIFFGILFFTCEIAPTIIADLYTITKKQDYTTDKPTIAVVRDENQNLIVQDYHDLIAININVVLTHLIQAITSYIWMQLKIYKWIMPTILALIILYSLATYDSNTSNMFMPLLASTLNKQKIFYITKRYMMKGTSGKRTILKIVKKQINKPAQNNAKFFKKTNQDNTSKLISKKKDVLNHEINKRKVVRGIFKFKQTDEKIDKILKSLRDLNQKVIRLERGVPISWSKLVAQTRTRDLAMQKLYTDMFKGAATIGATLAVNKAISKFEEKQAKSVGETNPTQKSPITKAIENLNNIVD